MKQFSDDEFDEMEMNSIMNSILIINEWIVFDWNNK